MKLVRYYWPTIFNKFMVFGGYSPDSRLLPAWLCLCVMWLV